MKFSININQKAAIDSGLQLDIVDLAIFDFLVCFSNSSQCKKYKHEQEEVNYYLFNWKLIIQQLPILGLTTRQTVYNRMQKLTAAGLIIAAPDNQVNATAYYRFGPNYDLLIFFNRVPNETQEPVKSHTPKPVKPILHNNGINTDKYNNDNIEGQVIKKKEDFIKLLITWEKLHVSKYPKIMYRNFFNYWTEAGSKKKKLILRYEGQEFFEMGKRLATWFSNCNDQDILAQWNADAKLPELEKILLKIVHGQ